MKKNLLFTLSLFFVCIQLSEAQCPTTSAITGSTSVCSITGPVQVPPLVTYSVSNTLGSTYAWTITGGTQESGGNTNSITVLWGAGPTGNVSVIETASGGCVGSAVNLPVTMNATPPVVNSTSSSLCTGGLTMALSPSTGGTWSTSPPQFPHLIWATVSSNGLITSAVGGNTGSQSFTFTTNNGCWNSLAINMVAVPPTHTISGSATSCINTANVGYSVLDTPGSTYVWSVTGGTLASGTSNYITVNWGATIGTGNVIVTETNAAGCSGTSNLPVSIGPSPSTSPITGSSSVCVGSQSVSYGVVGTSGSHYQWTVTGGTIVGCNGPGCSNNNTVNWDTAGIGNVSVIETTAAGCTGAVVNLPVTINSLPVVSAPSTTLCIGCSMLLSPTMGGTWSSSDNTIVTVTNAGVATGIKGQSSATLTFTQTSTGCSNYVYLSLPGPSVIYGNATVCSSTINSEYDIEANPGSTYTWTVTGGTITGHGTQQAGYPWDAIEVTWGAAGAGTVQVFETTSYGGVGTPTIFPVTINAQPATSAITGSTSVCANATMSYSVANTSGSTYVWYFSSGIQSSGTNTNGTTATWQGYGSQIINGEVTVVETNAFGCQGPTIALPVTINPLPSASSSILGTTNVCQNSSMVYNSSTYYDTGSSFAWTISGGYQTNGSNTAVITVNWGNAGTGNINFIETNSAGCPGPLVSLPVTINPIISGPAQTCGYTANFSAQGGMSNYVWSVTPDGTISNNGTSSAQITWTTTGPKTISVSYTDGGGHAHTVCPFNTVVNAITVPTISGGTEACNSSTYTYSAQPDFFNYIWNVSAGGIITAGGTSTSTSVTVKWNSTAPQTVSVNFTDNVGCTAASPTLANISIIEPVTPTLSGISTRCFGGIGSFDAYTTEAGMSGYIWTASPDGTITTADGSTYIPNGSAQTCGGPCNNLSPVGVSWNSPGTKTLSVSYISGGCWSYPATKNITVNALPSPTLTPSTNATCVSGSVTYTTDPGKSNYNWSPTGEGTIISGGTSTSNSATVRWNTSYPGYNYVGVAYTDANGCTNVILPTVNTTVWPLPSPTITPAGSTVCVNAPGNIYTTQAGMSNYIWSVPPSGTITAGGGPTDNSVTVTWNSSGVKNISVLYTDPAHGCQSQSSSGGYVNVIALPTPTIWYNTGCLTSGNVYNTEQGMSNYQWSISSGGTITAGGTSTDSNITVTWNTTGPKIVSVNYANSTGCTAASPTTINFTVNNLPVPSLSGLMFVPITHTVNTSPPYEPYTDVITYTTDDGMDNYIWWFDGTPNLDYDNVGGKAWVGIGTHSIQVTYTDANGCSPLIRTSQIVTVGYTQTVSIGTFFSNPYPYGAAPVNINASASSNLPVTLTSSNTSVATINGDQVTIVGVGSSVITATQAGNSEYLPASASQTLVVVKANPLISITSTSSGVYNNSIGLTTNTGGSTGAVTYSVSNGTGKATVSGNTLLPTGVGTVTVTVNIATDANYNAASTTQTITISKANPVVSITSASTGTYGGTIHLTANSGGSTGAVTYSIANGTGSASVSGSTLTLTGAGTVTVTASIATDANYNVGSASQIVTIGQASQIITFPTLSNICNGSSTTLNASSSNSSIPITYQSSDVSKATITTPGGIPMLNPIAVGTVIITASQSGNANYSAATNVSQSVTINPIPSATISPSGATSFCPGGSVTLSAPSGFNYLWSTNASSQSISVSTTGNYSVTVTNSNNCKNTSSMAVTVYPTPAISVSTPSPICAGSNVSLTATGASTYSWTPSGGLSATTGSNVTATPSTTTLYTITGTSSNGCSGTGTVNVTVIPIPTVTIGSSNGVNLCKVSSTTLTANVSPTPVTYSWSSSNNDYSSTNSYLVVSDPETYTVVVNYSDCTNSRSITTVRVGTNCNAQLRFGAQLNLVAELDPPDVDELTAYPNPASDKVVIAMPERASEDTPVSVYDMYGKIITSTTLKSGEWKTDLSMVTCAEGLYIVRVGNNNVSSAVKVMVVHK